MTSHDIVRVVVTVCLLLFSGMALALVAYMLHCIMETIKMEYAVRMHTKNDK
jgi:hypothetical protein